MRFHPGFPRVIPALLCAAILAAPFSTFAQQPDGPQSDAPPAVAPKPVAAQSPSSSEPIIVPAGTRVGVVLQPVRKDEQLSARVDKPPHPLGTPSGRPYKPQLFQ